MRIRIQFGTKMVSQPNCNDTVTLHTKTIQEERQKLRDKNERQNYTSLDAK